MNSNFFKKISFLFLFLFLLSIPLILLGTTEPSRAGGGVRELLAEIIDKIYFIALIVVGIVAVGTLVYAGIRLIISAGNPEVIKEARKYILSVFLGLLIVLFSVGILRFLHPDLIKMPKEPEIVAPEMPEIIRPRIMITDGIALIVTITDLDGNPVIHRPVKEFYRGGPNLRNLDRIIHMDQIVRININEIVFRNPADRGYNRYGVIVFEEPYFRGRSKVITGNIEEATIIGNTAELSTIISPKDAQKISSIKSFIMPENPHQNFNLIFYQYTETGRTKILTEPVYDEQGFLREIKAIDIPLGELGLGESTIRQKTKEAIPVQKPTLATTENPLFASSPAYFLSVQSVQSKNKVFNEWLPKQKEKNRQGSVIVMANQNNTNNPEETAGTEPAEEPTLTPEMIERITLIAEEIIFKEVVEQIVAEIGIIIKEPEIENTIIKKIGEKDIAIETIRPIISGKLATRITETINTRITDNKDQIRSEIQGIIVNKQNQFIAKNIGKESTDNEIKNAVQQILIINNHVKRVREIINLPSKNEVTTEVKLILDEKIQAAIEMIMPEPEPLTQEEINLLIYRARLALKEIIVEEINREIETIIMIDEDHIIENKIKKIIDKEAIINQITEKITELIPAAGIELGPEIIEKFVLPNEKIEGIIMGEITEKIGDITEDIKEKIRTEKIVETIIGEIDKAIGKIENISDEITGEIKKITKPLEEKIKGIMDDVITDIEEIRTGLEEIKAIPVPFIEVIAPFIDLLNQVIEIIETIEAVLETIELAEGFIKKIEAIMPLIEIERLIEGFRDEIAGLEIGMEQIITMPLKKIDRIVGDVVKEIEDIKRIPANLIAHVIPEGKINDKIADIMRGKILDEHAIAEAITDIMPGKIEIKNKVSQKIGEIDINTVRPILLEKIIVKTENLIKENENKIIIKIQDIVLENQNQIIQNINLKMPPEEIKKTIQEMINKGQIKFKGEIMSIDDIIEKIKTIIELPTKDDIINMAETILEHEIKPIIEQIVMPPMEILGIVNDIITDLEDEIEKAIKGIIPTEQEIINFIKNIWEEIFKLDPPKELAGIGEKIPKIEIRDGIHRITAPPIGAFKEFYEEMQKMQPDKIININLDYENEEVPSFSMQIIPEPRGKFLIILRNEFNQTYIVQENISDVRKIHWGKAIAEPEPEKANQGQDLANVLDLIADLDPFWDICPPNILEIAEKIGDEQEKEKDKEKDKQDEEMLIKGQIPVCFQIIHVIPIPN